MYYAGATDYKCLYNAQDLQLCKRYIREKTSSVPQEFTALVSIIMEEDNLHIPRNCYEALELYLDLVNSIQ